MSGSQEVERKLDLLDESKHPAHPGWLHLSEIGGAGEPFFDHILFLLGYDISSNIYLLTRQRPAIFDPGNDYTAYMALFQQHAVAPADIRSIVLSHGHRDHCMGLFELIRSYPAIRSNGNLEVIAHEACPQEIEDMTRDVGIALKKVRGGEVLELGGCQMEVLHTPGHTIDGISLYHAASKTVFTGDTVQPHMMAEPDKHRGGRLDHYLYSLRVLLKKDIDKVLPGHGAPILANGRRVLEETYESLMMKVLGVENPISWLDGASALLKQGLLEEALFCLDRWLVHRTDDPQALRMKVMCLNDLGRCEEALQLLDRLEGQDEMKPSDPFPHLSRGYALLGMGRHQESIAHFDRVLALHPGMEDAQVFKGMALYLAGDHEQALAIEPFRTAFAGRLKAGLSGKAGSERSPDIRTGPRGWRG